MGNFISELLCLEPSFGMYVFSVQLTFDFRVINSFGVSGETSVWPIVCKLPSTANSTTGGASYIFRWFSE